MTTLNRVAAIKTKAKRIKELEKLSYDPQFCKAVQELCLNLVGKNLPLNQECKGNLECYKQQIKCCSKGGVSSKTRRKHIIESAAYLPYLIPYSKRFLNRNKDRILKKTAKAKSPSVDDVTWTDDGPHANF